MPPSICPRVPMALDLFRPATTPGWHPGRRSPMRATIPVSTPSDPAGLAAPAEAERRRPGFLGGLPIPLADGQDWAFAGPREAAAAGPADRAAVADLLRGIDEADDHADHLRGELALAIHLLGLNYDLSPADYARLLTG